MADQSDLVLIVEDEALLRRAMEVRLAGLGHSVIAAADARGARRLLRDQVPDVVLLDACLPDADPGALLPEVRAACPETPVVLMTAYTSVEGAIDAFHQGAWDYLPKPFDLDRLTRLVNNALETTRLRRELRRFQSDAELRRTSSDIVARSPAMRSVLDVAMRVAGHATATVLLEGESGTGKGLVARAIHDWSPRRDGPFVTVTCAAIPAQLLESEIFGHVQGAFTGATGNRKGMAALAEGGTLFLDEIGEMEPALQAKILYLLEARRFRPVGSETERQADVRIVAATNRDLQRAVDDGAFREDLYFRLKVIPMRTPPLRERPEDVRVLAQRFLERANVEVARSVAGFTSEALDALIAYPWPGNVRELRNAVERALVVGEGTHIQLQDLPPEVRGEPPAAYRGSRWQFLLPPGGVDLDTVERDFVVQALRRTGGNRTEAGKLVHLNRDGVRYRIRKYGIDMSQFGAPGDRPRAEAPAREVREPQDAATAPDR